MPKRTNLFQEVVAIIHAHMAGDAEVEESAMLRNRLTGEESEVDVVIRSRVALHDVMVKFEARATARKADSTWVQTMLGKHEHLAPGTLVLVSESGFTGPARRLAEKSGAVPLAPEILADGDPVFNVVNALPSLWPKTIWLSPERATAAIEKPDGTRQKVRDVPPDGLLFFEDGSEAATVRDMFLRTWNAKFTELSEQIDLASITEDQDQCFVLGIIGTGFTIEVDGEQRSLYVRYEETDPPELHRVIGMEFIGRAVIKVTEIPLSHRRLGEVTYAFGEGKVGDNRALIVVTEDGTAAKASIRFRNT